MRTGDLTMQTPDQAQWIATEATVTSCRYQFARMNTLTLGLQTGKAFRITFEYYAHGGMHLGEFQSAVAIAQNERIPLRYNPLNPGENSYSADAGAGRSALVTVGVTGSIVLSLLWLAVLHGCQEP